MIYSVDDITSDLFKGYNSIKRTVLSPATEVATVPYAGEFNYGDKFLTKDKVLYEPDSASSPWPSGVWQDNACAEAK